MDINLLPWREELQEENRRRFFLALVAIVIISLLVSLGLHTYLNMQIANQITRNQYLTQQVNFYQNQIQEITTLKKARQDLIDRMKVIQALQATRPFTVKLFDAVVQVIPEGVYISSIKRNDTSIAIDGSSQSHEHVATLMRNIDKSKFFLTPELKKVENKKNSEFSYQFNMTFGIQPDNSESKNIKVGS